MQQASTPTALTDFTSSKPEPKGLLRLPDELLVCLLSHTADDDFAQLSLPLVCRAFRQACDGVVVSACRLASRMRQVAEALSNEEGPSPWLVGHAWGALLQARCFFEQGAEQSANTFAATPGGADSLRAIISWCDKLVVEQPPPPSAEATFMAAETKRLASLQAPSLSLIRQQCSGDRRALRTVAEAQAKRQLDAACRRSWRQLGTSQRNGWEQAAVRAHAHWQHQSRAIEEAIAIAATLSAQLSILRLVHGEQPLPRDVGV